MVCLLLEHVCEIGFFEGFAVAAGDGDQDPGPRPKLRSVEIIHLRDGHDVTAVTFEKSVLHGQIFRVIGKRPQSIPRFASGQMEDDLFILGLQAFDVVEIDFVIPVAGSDDDVFRLALRGCYAVIQDAVKLFFLQRLQQVAGGFHFVGFYGEFRR